jgi:hypothetical protein
MCTVNHNLFPKPEYLIDVATETIAAKVLFTGVERVVLGPLKDLDVGVPARGFRRQSLERVIRSGSRKPIPLA